MWIPGNQKRKEIINPNDEMMLLKGELSDLDARITLAKYLRHNLGITTKTFMGVNLEAYQELTLRSFFNTNFSMLVWGRGGAKSFCAAMYACLKCVFEPGTKVLIASANFRTSRRIFTELERFLNRPDAKWMAQCFGKCSKRNDEYSWEVNGGSIVAIPLSGERIRGIRANTLILDEFLLLPQQIIDEVLIPFLCSPTNVDERIKIRTKENDLIDRGLMTEDERMVFENTSQVLALSSASYTFEHLYQVYQTWTELIENPAKAQDVYREASKGKPPEPSTYFISQLSYEALPGHMVDEAAIELAKNGAGSHSAFLREYCARFEDGGDGFFSPKAMNACTIPDMEYPTTRIQGDPNKKYILGVDSNVAANKSSDFFAMTLLELNEEQKTSTMVHGYQMAGATYKETIRYFYYLQENFNIVLVILDNTGADQFIEAVNMSKLFSDKHIKYSFFDFESDKKEIDYVNMVKEAKKQYNPHERKICIRQKFSGTFISDANDYLQSNINHKRVWFASRAAVHPVEIEQAFMSNLDVSEIFPLEKGDKADSEDETVKMSLRDFVERQDYLVKDTKDQCANIVISQTATGHRHFDLPNNLRKLSGVNRPRKDNYTTLLLANWGVKAYYDLFDPNFKKQLATFDPIVLM